MKPPELSKSRMDNSYSTRMPYLSGFNPKRKELVAPTSPKFSSMDESSNSYRELMPKSGEEI